MTRKKGNLSSKKLKKIINEYKTKKKIPNSQDGKMYTEKERLDNELNSYSKPTPFKRIVEFAAKAQGHWNGIHKHQRRVGAKNLKKFAKKLSKVTTKLRRSSNFDKLYNVVAAKKTPGVGRLAIYDTALRIGSYLKIKPKEVYIQCGARKGAINAGIIPGKRRSIPRKEFPSAFKGLKAEYIENILCIYKNSLRV